MFAPTQILYEESNVSFAQLAVGTMDVSASTIERFQASRLAFLDHQVLVIVLAVDVQFNFHERTTGQHGDIVDASTFEA